MLKRVKAYYEHIVFEEDRGGRGPLAAYESRKECAVDIRVPHLLHDLFYIPDLSRAPV